MKPHVLTQTDLTVLLNLRRGEQPLVVTRDSFKFGGRPPFYRKIIDDLVERGMVSLENAQYQITDFGRVELLMRL